MCVAIDLAAAFDTVSHDILISKIAGSSLPPAITRWLSCYLSGRQAATSFRCTKSSAPASFKDPSCHLHCSTITLLICQGRLHRSRGFLTLTTSQSGLLTKDPTTGVHDQQLPERGRHLPEGKLAFDLCAKVNSHALHSGQTPVIDASRHYS